jgi:hypothetical protein
MAMAVKMTRVSWQLDTGFVGHGEWLTYDLALEWKKHLEKKYPWDTYWLEEQYV